jgi:hypothetical protein
MPNRVLLTGCGSLTQRNGDGDRERERGGFIAVKCVPTWLYGKHMLYATADSILHTGQHVSDASDAYKCKY